LTRACALKRYACLREAAPAEAGRASVNCIKPKNKKPTPFEERVPAYRQAGVSVSVIRVRKPLKNKKAHSCSEQASI